MTRPCVRCGRSIGETTCCGNCWAECIDQHGHLQRSDEDELRRVAWDGRRHDPLMDRPGVDTFVFPPRFSDHIREAHLTNDGHALICEDALMTTRARVAVDGYLESWIELTPEFMTFTAPRATTEDLAPIWRLVDVWLWRLDEDPARPLHSPRP